MRQHNTSVDGHALSRPQAIRYFVAKALNRRGLLFKTYVEQVVQYYNATVPEHARELKAFDLNTVNGLMAAQKRISRLVNTPLDERPQPIPSELEEALVEALPETERTECRAHLCERYGVIAVPHSELSSNRELADLGAFVRESGEAIHQLSKVLTNVGIDQMPIKEVMLARKELMDVIETAMCITKQIDEITSRGDL